MEERKLSIRARCLMVSTLAKSSLTDLRELAGLSDFLEGLKEDQNASVPVETSETLELIRAELARRDRLSREALERIWLEPLGRVSYEPLPDARIGDSLKRRSEDSGEETIYGQAP